MKIKRVKRKCSVRGCKNTDCFAISNTNEVGNSVIICASCLKEGAKAVDGYVPEPKKPHTPPPALFYNVPAVNEDVAEEVAEAVEETELTVEEVEEATEATTEEVVDSNPLVCPVCGKECKSEAGLKKHMTSHKEDE